MKRHTTDECTVEVFEDWAAASDGNADGPMASANIGTIRPVVSSHANGREFQ